MPKARGLQRDSAAPAACEDPFIITAPLHPSLELFTQSTRRRHFNLMAYVCLFQSGETCFSAAALADGATLSGWWS